MQRTLRLSILSVAILLVAAACSTDDDLTTARSFGGDSASTTAAGSFDEGRAAPTEPEQADEALVDDAAATNAQAVLSSLDVIDLGRSIIFTASVHIEVDDVLGAGAEIEGALAGLGTLLFGQETSTGESPRSVLTIKVPPDRFDDALDRLAGVGELISQDVFADDVTERVVDLESRIATAGVSVTRLRALLEEAADIDGVVALESELVQRETDLEVLRGQLRTLDDAVALATIVVVLTEPLPDVPEPALEVTQTGYIGHDGGTGCPGTDEVTVDEGGTVTICFVLTNTGNTALAEIEVRDFGLEAEPDDLLVVDGDPAVALLPDEHLTLAFETTADPDQFTAPNVSATSVDEDGEPLRVQVEVDVSELFLRIVRDTSLPGFADGLAAAWEALERVIGVIVLTAGAIVPFLWVPLLAAAGWWWRRRRDGGVAE